MTLYGGSGGVMTYSDSSDSAVYQAGAGNETLDAAGSQSNLTILGGLYASSNASMVGGTGQDTFFAGTGSDTMVANAAKNDFVFYKSVIAGAQPSDVISGFQSSDTVYLAGYGSGAAAQAIASASVSAAGTTLTLADNTKITFSGVTSASSLSGHIVSF